MDRSLVRKEVIPFAMMFGGLILATVITDTLLHQFDLVWIGRWLGIPGTILILLSFFYSMRKRKMISCGNQLTFLDISNNTNLTLAGFDNMPMLTKVCVWALPFPPSGVSLLMGFSPNVVFEMGCSN